MPAVIQVLHTWGQELNYHPHIHCIISGAGLTPDMRLTTSRPAFMIPVRVLGAKFKGKFMDALTAAVNCSIPMSGKITGTGFIKRTGVRS